MPTGAGVEMEGARPEHSRPLTSMNNLAVVLDSQGKYEAVEEMHRRSLELREEVLGPEHLSTQVSRVDLAQVQHLSMQVSRVDLARVQHLSMQLSRVDLARVLKDQG
jgi:hypothetical protein